MMVDLLLLGVKGLTDESRYVKEISQTRGALDGLCASLAILDDARREIAIVGELANLSRRLPFLAVAIYRSVLRDKFATGFDVRELTSFIAYASTKISPAYRSQLWRREVEGLIRADLGGEPDLINRFEYDRQQLKDIILLLVRVILLEGSGRYCLADVLPAQVRAASSDISQNPSKACMVIASIFAAKEVTSAELIGAMQSIELAMAGYR